MYKFSKQHPIPRKYIFWADPKKYLKFLFVVVQRCAIVAMDAVPANRNEEQQRCGYSIPRASGGLDSEKGKTVTDNSNFVNHIILKKISIKT